MMTVVEVWRATLAAAAGASLLLAAASARAIGLALLPALLGAADAVIP